MQNVWNTFETRKQAVIYQCFFNLHDCTFKFSVGEGKSIFWCMGSTDPNFCQIKIILISHLWCVCVPFDTKYFKIDLDDLIIDLYVLRLLQFY